MRSRRFRALLALLLLALPASGCGQLFFQPTREEEVRPELFGFHPERVTFPSLDGTLLSGWYFKSRHPKGLIVFFHGNAENISTHFVSLAWILDQGYDYFIFDYRGYGASQGEPSRAGAVADGKAAIWWAYLRRPDLPLVVLGQSLGGAIAQEALLELGRVPPVRLLVLDSTFSSYRDAARSVLSRHWLTWWLQPAVPLLIDDEQAPLGRIAELAPMPILIIHGDQDEIIDYALGQRLYESAREPKEFWTVPGGGHIESLARDELGVRERLIDALDATVSGGGCTPGPLSASSPR